MRALVVVGLVALVTLSACSRHATPEECQQILDRYVDFTIDGDPSLKGIPEETRGAAWCAITEKAFQEYGLPPSIRRAVRRTMA